MTIKRDVIDFDHHSPEYARRVYADPTGFFQQMQREHPVAWTEKYGGFWVISRYEDIKRVSEDDALFSSRNDLPHQGPAYSGITIPGNGARSTPIEMDPPEFFDYRRLLNRWFAPAAIEQLKPQDGRVHQLVHRPAYRERQHRPGAGPVQSGTGDDDPVRPGHSAATLASVRRHLARGGLHAARQPRQAQGNRG